MTIKVESLRGITEDTAAKLNARGIKDSEGFLAACRTVADRKALASELGIDPKAVLELANRADLARIKGVAAVRGDLLEEIGVDTVKELAQRNAQNLHARIVQIHEERKTAFMPTLEEVTDWIAQAKELPRALEY